MSYKDTLEQVYSNTGLAPAKKRRELLVDQMFANEASGLDCLNCTGRCCTFEANSMQMTSVEALEAMAVLEEKNLLNDETKKRLEDCISEFRLDKYIQIGPGEYFRKSYTCPFYFYPSFGCGLGVDHKPYGCIAFNPCEASQEDGGNCQSDLDIQEKRNLQFEKTEDLADKYLFEQYKISQLKEPIPIKLLEVWKKI
ncbi:hypothetical protein M902_1795 [Bacteriovorax sp. BAL6_X]|uniref:hypothetical protein n=1 Tax=Bacteriovorax sp. BAL6_X TaxID=1201290 RepID=UPI0003855296|nr:hypothetical protein [Bacteriovorax sp. BAL6_X]EPZ51843.1 hypothetical protein M902_1795 [Bacteriovorax sp. BAL6_X]